MSLAVDVNKDGWITVPEYKHFCQKAGLKWKFWKLIFAMEDADQDGLINWWEYMGPKYVGKDWKTPPPS